MTAAKHRPTTTAPCILLIMAGMRVATPSATGEAGAGVPAIACEKPVYEFGVVRGKAEIEHTFILSNTGRVDLKIVKVQVSCGCATTRIGKSTIAPGDTGEVGVRFILKGRYGPQDRSFYVHSNDPQKPYFRLGMKGVIHNDVDVIPMHVLFNEALNAPGSEETVRIVCNLDTPLRVTGLDTGHIAFCHVTLDPTTNRHEHVVRLRVDAQRLAEPGLLRGDVGVLTDHTNYARISIPVTLYVRRAINVIPREISLPPSSPDGQTLTRFVFVKSDIDHSFEILDVTPPDREMQVTPQKMAPGKHRILIQNIQPSSQLDGESLEIRLRDRAGNVETIAVPLRVRGAGETKVLP